MPDNSASDPDTGNRIHFGYKSAGEKPTAASVLNTALNFAATAGIAELNVRLLMADLLGVSLPALALHKDKFLTTEQIKLFESQVKRLLSHEPLQYILGKAHFYGLELTV